MNPSYFKELTALRAEHNAPTWRFGGDCTEPQFAGNIGLFTRCRKCPACLDTRKEQWIARSIDERAKWPKAWFLTLTYADPSEYSYENFKQFIKAVRHRGNVDRISFICTDEYDSSGERNYNPHHHLVLYGDENITYRTFDRLWTFGHSKKNLLYNRSASYVAKYLTKAGNRVRASQGYGSHTYAHLNLRTLGWVHSKLHPSTNPLKRSNKHTPPRSGPFKPTTELGTRLIPRD